jgi:hypothetical protein
MLFLAAAGTAGTLDASWTAPTTSADGSPLADLASYRVYFGTSGSPCTGPSSVTVASATASPAPGTTVTTRLSGLTAGATYSVAISAIDTSGNEGSCSTSVSGAVRASVTASPTETVNFGSVSIGSSATRTFTVQNTSGGTVTGAVSVPAPFSVVSGSPFSLAGLNATQTVTVRFTPTSTATATANVTVAADGDSLTRIVTGAGVNVTDTTRPTVSITSPTSGTTFSTSSTSLTLGGTAADNIGVTQVSWTNSAGGSGTASGTTSWSAAGIALRPGSNALTVTARDAAGNAATAQLTVTVTDTTAPSVAIATPTSAVTHVTRTSPLALGGAASDNVAVTQVSWANSAGGSGTATGTATWSVAGVALQPGSNVLTVTARDAAANARTATLTVTYDPTAPTVSLTGPTSGVTVSGTTTITAAAADNVGVAGVQFLLDGAALGAEQTSGFSLAWNTLAVSNGAHVLSARARDAAGNTTVSAGIPVTVSNAQPSGLVAAYGFNETTGTTVSDASGHGNTGSFGAGVGRAAQGRFGGALVFDGTGFVAIPGSPSLTIGSAMTLEAWVAPSTAQSGWRTVIQREVDAYFLNASNDGGALKPAGGGTLNGAVTYVTAANALPVNAWSHLALTYDGTALRLYVNGALVTSQARTGAVQTTTTPVRIGGNVPYGEFFQGAIDEVRIYNRALSAAEIQNDMNTAVGSASSADTAAPTLAITAPTSATTYTTSSSPLSLGGTAADNVGVSQVAWTSSAGGSGIASGTTSWSAGGIVLQPGTNTLTVTARDAAGNSASRSFSVTFTPNVSLTVTKGGTGTGTVTSTPAGISCGSACSAGYASGSSVTLTATPTANSSFTGWSGGGCSGTDACTVSVTAATSVNATFALQTFPLSVTVAGTGRGSIASSPAGISCGSACSASYSAGSTVTLTATPAAGSVFAGWSGGCTGTGTCVVTMAAATAVTASFAVPTTHVLGITMAGSGTGTITSTPAGISCGTGCVASFPSGTTVTLTARPTFGTAFMGWSGGGCSGTGSCVVTMSSATSVTATWRKWWRW